MRYLQDVHEMNVYRAGPVCLYVLPSVRMIELETHWTNFDYVWCRRHATAVCPELLLFNFLQSVIPTWSDTSDI
jgi:hypothetical protein